MKLRPLGIEILVSDRNGSTERCKFETKRDLLGIVVDLNVERGRVKSL